MGVSLDIIIYKSTDETCAGVVDAVELKGEGVNFDPEPEDEDKDTVFERIGGFILVRPPGQKSYAPEIPDGEGTFQ